jgi:hypothetical protein
MLLVGILFKDERVQLFGFQSQKIVNGNYPCATFKAREGSGANDSIAFPFNYCYKFVLAEFHVPL